MRKDRERELLRHRDNKTNSMNISIRINVIPCD